MELEDLKNAPDFEAALQEYMSQDGGRKAMADSLRFHGLDPAFFDLRRGSVRLPDGRHWTLRIRKHVRRCRRKMKKA